MSSTLLAEPVVEVRRGGIDVVEDLAPEWRALCDEQSDGMPFTRPEWIAANIRAFAPEAKIALVAVRVGGVLRAVLPLLFEWTRFYGLPVRKLRSPGNVHSVMFDLVLADTAEPSVMGAVWQGIRSIPGWDLLELQDVPDSGTVRGILDAANRQGWPVGRWEMLRSPCLALPGPGATADEALHGVNAKFRSTVRRHAKKLAQGKQLHLTRIGEAEPEALAGFYELERSGWKGQEGTAIACHADTREFYDGAARAAARYGYLSLYLLERDHDLIAAQFGLTYGGRYYLLKPAYDESLKAFGPGQLIMYEVLVDAVQRGLTGCEFLGSDDEWKLRWTSDTRTFSWYYAFQPGPYGRLLHLLKFRVMRTARRVKHRAFDRRTPD